MNLTLGMKLGGYQSVIITGLWVDELSAQWVDELAASWTS